MPGFIQTPQKMRTFLSIMYLFVHTIMQPFTLLLQTCRHSSRLPLQTITLTPLLYFSSGAYPTISFFANNNQPVSEISIAIIFNKRKQYIKDIEEAVGLALILMTPGCFFSGNIVQSPKCSSNVIKILLSFIAYKYLIIIRCG
jgi:hypothetical protein